MFGGPRVRSAQIGSSLRPVKSLSFTTDAFSTRSDQCPLLLAGSTGPDATPAANTSVVIELKPTCRERARSNPNSVRKQRIAPFIERPHEIGSGMDRLPFTGEPFPSVRLERKVFDIVVAGLLPMLD